MSNITIFEQPSNVPTVKRQSKLADKMVVSSNLRRIATNTNGTFKRIVNGEQVGKAVPHEVDVIIVDLLRDVSREYYVGDYDPDAKGTLPDCWSNLGDVPDPKAKNKQAASCANCPMNVDGSGKKGKGKACRFKRRVAVLIAGDPSGEVYQMSFAAMSLFGKGVGNVHPFESYKKFLVANGEGVDTVVTRVMYDLDADTMTLKFKAVRHLTQTEADLVDAAQDDPETQRYINMTVGEMDGGKPAQTAAPEPKVVEAKAEPTKAANPFDTGDEEEDTPAQPQTRTRKAAPATPTSKPKLADALAGFLGNDDGDE